MIGARGERYAVLFVSNSRRRRLRGTKRRQLSAEAKRMLGDDLGSVILDPLANGEFRGFSFVLWPWHRPVTSIRGLAYLQRLILLPRVLGWLRDATKHTARDPDSDEIETAFGRPLALNSARSAFSGVVARVSTAGARSARIRRMASPRRPGAQRLRPLEYSGPRDRAHRQQFPRALFLSTGRVRTSEATRSPIC